MTMAPFETVMTFDGSNVMLEQARLSSPEIEAFLSGPINRVLDSPSLDLALKGSVNLDNAIKWVPPPPVPVTGMATIEGTITGPARNFALDLAVHSNTLDVGRERELGLAGAGARHVRIVLRTRPRDLAAVGRIDSRQVQRAVGQGVDQHREPRNGAASTRRRRCAWPTSTRRRSAARSKATARSSSAIRAGS